MSRVKKGFSCFCKYFRFNHLDSVELPMHGRMRSYRGSRPVRALSDVTLDRMKQKLVKNK